MARSASSENIRRDQEGPDFQAVIGLVRGQLRTNDSDQRSLAQDNSTIFKRIEKNHGVHKGAAKDFSKIDNMAPEKRTDYLRSLLGLLGFAGYSDFNDLVDRMQSPGKKTPSTPKPKADATPPKAPAAPDALDADEIVGTRINLKSGWLQKVDPAHPTVADAWLDVREATPEELAAERERQADFNDGEGGGNVLGFPAGAKTK